MAIPVINAIINFSTGPGFAQAMILDQGVLGTNVLADAASVIVDVSDVVDRISTVRGRNITADQFQTGTLSLRIVDQSGNFNPENPLSPYAGLLSPMRKITITATYDTVTYPIFAGYITSYQYVIPSNTMDTIGYTTITAVDAFRLANLANITTVTGATAGDLTGTRINQILDQISWPATMRDIDAGLTTCQTDPGTSRTSLGAMQTVETTEYGALYVSASGSFVFQDRQVTSTSVAATPTVFADDGSGIDYYDAKWNLSDILVYNQANITATGLAMQTATNAASIAQYFAHTYIASGLLMQDTATALNYAQAYVASRAQTAIRCDQLTLDLYTANYDLGIKAALGLDFFDPVSIQTSQPGNTSISKTEQIFGVAMDITPGTWRVNFTTMEAVIDSFILNSTLYGILDTSVLSY
jgi:hypothetical protein